MSELEPTSTEHEPTATEHLRALLDERGEYYKTSGNRTWWGRPIDAQTGKPINVFHNQAQPMGEDRLLVELQLATPEQAIAATLGSCSCSSSERTETCRLEGFADVPFSVDYEIEGYDMGSSRDYATLAECSSCGAYVILPPEYHHVLTCDGDEVYQPYRFCPNCGRKVVDA